jgi:Xaa-Pro dipeptidase
MAQEGVALAMFEDSEERRDVSIRWLSGQPGDALLFLSVERKCLLRPWDINLAKIFADADFIIPYGEAGRLPRKALVSALKKLKIPGGSKVEVPPATPYPDFLDFVGAHTDYDILCRKRCAASKAARLRAIKDSDEIKIIKKAATITNELIAMLEKQVRAEKIKTETGAALFIEAESRKLGCEGTGFTTLAAGADRSFGIHAFPAYTASPFGGAGLSILDFGLKFAGYTSDVTLTFARDCTPSQEKIIGLVEKAHKLAAAAALPGARTRDIARSVDDFFAKSKKAMPHALGHGIGLEEHEFPDIRNREDNDWVLEPGMVFTLEPGLYDPIDGGCRLENDFLMTEKGPQTLTESKIIRLE